MELKSEYRRTAIAKAIINSQELGGKSKEAAITDAGKIEYEGKHDPLTEFIVDAIRRADDTKDIEQALKYGLEQLQKAIKAIESPQL